MTHVLTTQHAPRRTGEGISSVLERLRSDYQQLAGPADLLVATSDAVDRGLEPWLQRLLSEIREHLHMDVVFVSQFRNGRRVFRQVATTPQSPVIATGASDPLEQSWCARVVDGRLPMYVEDAKAWIDAGVVPSPHFPMGTHVSVPIVLPDGRVFGTVCGFSFARQTQVGRASLDVLRDVAALLAGTLASNEPRDVGNSHRADVLQEFRNQLAARDLHAALGVLNRRVPFRFTGLYRLGDGTLHNVALFDRWTPDVRRGDDAPLAETFCAIAARSGEPLEVRDGRSDARFAWMQGNPVQAYAGAPIKDERGVAVGTLCHFDLKPCQATRSELDILAAAARTLTGPESAWYSLVNEP